MSLKCSISIFKDLKIISRHCAEFGEYSKILNIPHSLNYNNNIIISRHTKQLCRLSRVNTT